MSPKTKPADSPSPAAAKPTARARVSNGKQTFLERVDGRSLAARRWRDLFRTFMAETGGRNEPMVRMLASLCLQRDLMDVRLAKGEDVEAGELVKLSGEIRRVMARLGIVEADEEIDGTDAAIAALRTHHTSEAASP